LQFLPRYDAELRAGGIVPRGRRVPKSARLIRLDRGFCRHTSYPRVPGAAFFNERQAIRLKAQSTAPFHNSDFAILWGKTRVSVFYWDRDRVAAELRAGGLTPTEQTVILPSNFFEAAGRDIELRTHDDGVELQVWDGGALQLSRWWHHQPTPEQVAGLLEPLDLGREQLTATDASGKRSAAPVRMTWRNLPDYILLFRGHLVSAALIANIAVATYALGGVLTVWNQQADLAARQAAIKPAEAGVVEARKQAIASGQWLDAYESVRGPRRHLPLMNAFLTTIEPIAERVTLEAWEYERGKLAATLKLKGEIDLRQVVKSLETHRLFKDVNSESNALQSNIRLTMTVVPGGKP
jgi:hypothetical protein